MFKIDGKVKYYNDYCVAYVDNELSRYARSLIPKSYYINKQRYDSHLTIVRKGAEFPKNLEFWGKHDGQKVEIWYNPVIDTCGTYFWINAQSPQIGEIRKELGLREYRYGDSYHITIGNVKNNPLFCDLSE